MLEKAELRLLWRRRLLMLFTLHMLLFASQSEAKGKKKGGKSSSSNKPAKASPAQRIYGAATVRQGLASVNDGKCPLIRRDPKELDVGMDKPLGVHFSCCAEGNIGDLLKGLSCATTSIYVNMHCGGECKLCKNQKPGILPKGSKHWKGIMSKLKVPKALAGCTQLEVDPPGGMRWVMLFNFLHHDYDNLPRTLVFLKDSYRNTVYKAERRNKGSFIKKMYPKLVKGLPIPINKVLQMIVKGSLKIGFQHITQRVNWGTGGFLQHDYLGQAMGDFYKFFSCTEVPEKGWPAIPGGLVAVERARVRRLPQRAYGELRSILLKLRHPDAAGMGAVSIEHNIATAFGCAGPETYPKCPPLASNWTSEQTLSAEEALFKGVPALPPGSHTMHSHPMPSLDAPNKTEEASVPAKDDADRDDGEDDKEEEKDAEEGDDDDDDDDADDAKEGKEVGDGGGNGKGDDKDEFKDDDVDVAEEEASNDQDGGGEHDDDREFMDENERQMHSSKATQQEPSELDGIASAPLSPWLAVIFIVALAYGAYFCSQRQIEAAEQTRTAKSKQPVGM